MYNSWTPFKITNNVNISHNFYTNDVLLFGKATVENARIIMAVLQNFGQQSKLFVNFQKSKIVFFPNLIPSYRHLISKKMGMSTLLLLGNIWGLVSCPPN